MPGRQIGSSWPAILILAAASVFMTVFVVQTRATTDEEQLAVGSSKAGPSQILPQNIYKPTLRIWVHGDGIRPRMMRTSPGLVVLRVENGTRSDISLVLEKVRPGEVIQVARVTTSNQGRRARHQLPLGVGEYVYYDEARPRIRGTLIVALPER